MAKTVLKEARDSSIKSKRQTLAAPQAAQPLEVFEEGDYRRVNIDDIEPNPDQPRKHFNKDRLQELAQSIKERGVLQPVIIEKGKGKTWMLAAGERRFRAAKLAGLNKIPAIITTKGDPAVVAIIENVQREDLNPIEEAEGYGRLVSEYNYTQKDLVEKIGKSKTRISSSLSLNKLPEEIKKEARTSSNYPRRLLEEIAKLKTPEEMIRLFKTVKDRSLKSDQVRKITSKRSVRTPAAIVSDRANTLLGALGKLDLGTIEQSEKLVLIGILQDLRNKLQKILDS